MSKDKDAGKGPLKGSGDPAAKKPAAIIDLKATELPAGGGKSRSESTTGTAPAGVAVPASGVQAATMAAAQPASSTRSSGAQASVPASSSSKSASAADKDPAFASTTTQKSTGDKAATEKTPAAAAKPSAPAPAVPRRPSGLVTLLTHATAGVLGGLIALLAADTVGQRIGQQLGLPMSESAQQGKAMQDRLGLLEAQLKTSAAASGAADPALAGKLQAAERRIGELEKAGADLAALKQAQTKLSADAQALAERVAKAGPTDASGTPVDASGRLAKLEEQLGLLTSAAGTDPQKGRIPQLAALSGKVADLEVALSGGLAGVRKSVTQEIEARLGQLAEQSEAARSGVGRLDRDLGQVKSEATRTTQRLEGLKTQADQLAAGLDGLKADVGRDLKSAVQPVATKVSALETAVLGVVKSEEDRRASAERVVLSLELANLKRAVDRGGPYATELAEVQRVAGGRLDLAVLEPAKAKGLPTLADLARDFRGLAHAMIEADRTPADGGVVDRLLAGAKSIVRVRKTDAAAADDKSVEAVVARMEMALKAGQMQGIAAEAATLSKQAQAPARDWLDKVAARAAVETAMAKVDEQLKSTLGAKAKGAQ